MKTRIYLIRHDESEHNINGIISGQVNPALTPNGQEQAKKARQKFQDITFDVVYSSDLTRAVQTAEILHQKSVHENNQLVELRERNFGSIDGKKDDHLVAGNELKDQLEENEKWHFKHVPDMESDHELVTRYLEVLEDLATKHSGKTIMIVAHGTAIRTVLRKILELPYDNFPSGSFKNTDHAILDYTDGVFSVIERP